MSGPDERRSACGHRPARRPTVGRALEWEIGTMTSFKQGVS